MNKVVNLSIETIKKIEDVMYMLSSTYVRWYVHKYFNKKEQEKVDGLL